MGCVAQVDRALAGAPLTLTEVAGSTPATSPRCQTVSAAGIEQLHGMQRHSAARRQGAAHEIRTWGFIAMSSLANEIQIFMTSVGAVRSDKLTGGDHIKWTLPNGNAYFTSLSPSDHRVLKNIRSEVNRILGTRTEGGKKAASYSKKVEHGGFSMETAKRDQQHSAAIREITGRATASIIRIDSLLKVAQRNRDQREGERLVEQYMSHRATLERYYQPVPELTCKSRVAQQVAA